MLNYPQKDDLLKINALATSAYGQKSVLLSESNLEFCLAGMRRYGEEAAEHETRVICKAAYLLYHLAFDYHAFIDGNKRTALVSCFSFIEMNIGNYNSDAFPAGEKAEFVKAVAEGKRTISAIEKWLAVGLKK